MLDLRPLFFINVLALLTLVTAGFARLNNPSPETVAAIGPSDAAPASVTATANVPVDSGSTLTTKRDRNPATGTLAARIEDFAPLTEDTTEVFEDVILFVDQMPANAAQGQADASVAAEVAVPAPTLAALTTESTALQRTAEAATRAEPTPTAAPEAPLPPAQGKLMVRSNVKGDQVLINGRARGSSGQTLTLDPGTYDIVVIREGYLPWRSSVALGRGDTRTVNVTLERITRVEFIDGTWKNGVVTGTGSWVDGKGNRYEGEFLDGQFHGKGRLVQGDGLTYDGEWLSGRKHGMGNLKLPGGDTYVGEFRDDEYNGQGTLTQTAGDILSGYWVNGTLNGDGSLTRRDGTLYTGGFVDGRYQGNGSITYPDGTYYEGSFVNGLYQGKGELTFADGKKYVGNFLESQFHGQGELMNPNGSKISGSFKFGKPIGVATLTTAEGEVFTARSDNPGVCYRLKSYRATECPKLEGW